MSNDLRRQGEIRVHDTYIGVWEEHVDTHAMRKVFRALREHFQQRGFAIALIPSIAKSIRQNYRAGRKSDLELYMETSGRTAKVEFFQNVANVSNPNGGRYDFGKLLRMPRHLRLMCTVEMVSAIRFLQTLGYTLDPALQEPIALSMLRRAEGREEDGLTPLECFNRKWATHWFNRDETGWPALSETNAYGYKDRDGATLKPGDTRYLYHRGTLIRGYVYPNMNGMWTVRLADGTWINSVTSGYLFSTDRPDLLPRRAVLEKAKQSDRLQTELVRATNAQKWRRVAALGNALASAEMGGQ